MGPHVERKKTKTHAITWKRMLIRGVLSNFCDVLRSTAHMESSSRNIKNAGGAEARKRQLIMHQKYLTKSSQAAKVVDFNGATLLLVRYLVMQPLKLSSIQPTT